MAAVKCCRRVGRRAAEFAAGRFDWLRIGRAYVALYVICKLPYHFAVLSS
jgi:hypothetical protein